MTINVSNHLPDALPSDRKLDVMCGQSFWYKIPIHQLFSDKENDQIKLLAAVGAPWVSLDISKSELTGAAPTYPVAAVIQLNYTDVC